MPPVPLKPGVGGQMVGDHLDTRAAGGVQPNPHCQAQGPWEGVWRGWICF